MAFILNKIQDKDEKNYFLFNSITNKKEMSFYEIKQYVRRIEKKDLFTKDYKELIALFMSVFLIVPFIIGGLVTSFILLNNTFLNIIVSIFIYLIGASIIFYMSKNFLKLNFLTKDSNKLERQNFYDKFQEVDQNIFVKTIQNNLINKLVFSNIKSKNHLLLEKANLEIEQINYQFEVLKNKLNISKNRDYYTDQPFEKFINYIDSIEIKIEQIKEV